jgi:hypothetical protein
MKQHPFYAIFCLLVVTAVAAAEWRGWSPVRAAESRTAAPRTVRENPGAYRSHYFASRSGYLRGK